MGPGHAFSSAAAIFRLPPACVTDIMKALTDSPVRHTCGKKKGWDIMELSALQNGSDIRGVAVDANNRPLVVTKIDTIRVDTHGYTFPFLKVGEEEAAPSSAPESE